MVHITVQMVVQMVQIGVHAGANRCKWCKFLLVWEPLCLRETYGRTDGVLNFMEPLFDN